MFKINEYEMSHYNFDYADVSSLTEAFHQQELMVDKLLEKSLVMPAYEGVLRSSHYFNLLDARRAISVTERQAYILRVRKLAQK